MRSRSMVRIAASVEFKLCFWMVEILAKMMVSLPTSPKYHFASALASQKKSAICAIPRPGRQ